MATQGIAHQLAQADRRHARSKVLLAAGVGGGPLYIAVSLLQALMRAGFDMRRHPFSLLTAGDLGWIQLTNFVVTGLLFTGAAVGLREAMRGRRGGTWGPRLLGAFGMSFVSAGIFGADPALGFPPGTSAQHTVISWHGWIHLVAGSLGFLCLLLACFAIARHFSERGQRAWRIWSRVQGVLMIAAVIGISSGSKSEWATPAFTVAACLGLLWISTVAAHFERNVEIASA